MYTTKSFCNVLAFLSNTPGNNSPIGEITSYGSSFSREVGIYQHSTLKGYDLINLRSIENDVLKTMSTALVDQAIAIVNICAQRTLTTPGEHYEHEIREELMQAATALKFTDVKVGRMATNGTYWVPSSITWTDTSAGASPNIHRVWLAIDAFINQYTDFNHIIVPPLEPVDQFFAAPSVVIQRLGAITPDQMMDRAQDARGGIPATVTRLPMFEWIDPTNNDRRVPSYWGIVINGLAGDNPDAIKDSLAEHILKNSEYPRSRWEEILPDIFKRTEFIHVPMYHRMARESSVLQHGIYSPIIPPGNENQQIVIKNAPGYNSTYVLNTASAYNFPYRSISIANIGSPENRDGKVLFSDHFPDYNGVGTENADFNRQSEKTQGFYYKLITALIQAEAWHDGMDLERGYYRIDRDDATYVAFTYENVQHLVVAKSALKV